MSDEAVWKAKLERADARIAELEAKLKTTQMQAQFFANAIVDGAKHLNLLAVDQTTAIDGVRVLKLFDDIVNHANDAWAKGSAWERERLAQQTLRQYVIKFHEKFGQPIGSTPFVPDEAMMRFRLSLIAEEFFELLDASLSYPIFDEAVFAPVLDAIKRSELSVNLPEFVDAMADLDYVVEGTRIVMGIDGAPIAEEVQRANMSKDAVYVAAKDEHHKNATVKPTKPADWKPPAIAEKLREQGWEG